MRDGLIGAMTVSENFILDTYHREPYSKRGSLNAKAIAERAETAVKDYDVRTPSIDTYAGSLSGGNQQKVVVAREFSRPVKLVVASQPTRGLDVGSIEYIHRRMVEQRDAGAAVLIVSTELDEVLAVGDRVAVMLGGQIVGILEGEEATYEKVGMLMGGARVRRIGRALKPAVIPILAVITAFIVGSFFILITDFESLVQARHGPGRSHHGRPRDHRHRLLRDGDRRPRRPGQDRRRPRRSHAARRGRRDPAHHGDAGRGDAR